VTFSHPWFFLLIVFAILASFFMPTTQGRLLYSNVNLIKKASRRQKINPRFILLIIRFLGLFFLILACMRPQAGKKFTEISSRGVDIFLVLDTSGSMKAMDFEINRERITRLDVVKKTASDFIKKRPTDRMGLVVFGTEAFTQCPLTLDHGVLLSFLDNLTVGMAGDATAIGSAIGTAVKRMKDLEAKSKTIILITDGTSNAGEIPPIKAAEIANEFKIKIYTIAVGVEGEAPFLVDTMFGKRYIYQNVPIDEETLKKIASITGGVFYRATDTKKLEEIYSEIDKLETTEKKIKEYTEYNELFQYFAFISLLMILGEVIVANTLFRKIP